MFRFILKHVELPFINKKPYENLFSQFREKLKLLMLSKQASKLICRHDNSRGKEDRDFGFFAIDWFRNASAGLFLV